MNIYGIRIKDAKRNIVSVKLNDILQMIDNGNLFYWSILWLEASGNLGEGNSIISLEENIANSKNGLIMKWEDLTLLSNKFNQIIELCVVGCKDGYLLNRYSNSEEMYKKCDIVIEMVDGSFWEIHSKDLGFITKIKENFKDIELLH
jgi:hypothetical protein